MNSVIYKSKLTIFSYILLLVCCSSGSEIINIHLNCDYNANDGNAVVITIVQLKNADKFRFSNLESLSKNIEAVLGTDLIMNSKIEKIMIPNESFDLKNLEIKKEASFLGILADFYKPSVNGWNLILPLTEDFKDLKLFIHKNTISTNVID